MIATPNGPWAAPTRALATLLVTFAAAAAHAQCPPNTAIGQGSPSTLSAGPVQASWATEPSPPQVGEPFVLRVTLCPADAQLLKVDATMPDHRHGMNYLPSLTPLGNGQWQVNGMVWHMAGRWELRLQTQLAGATHTLTQSVQLK